MTDCARLHELADSIESSARLMDELLAGGEQGGLWMGRAGHLRYLSVVVRKWGGELPPAGDVAEMVATEADALRRQNLLLVAAIEGIERTTKSLRDQL